MGLIKGDWKPLPHQVELLTALDPTGDAYKRAVLVWHRRAGKDQTSWQHLIAEACQKVGTYHYVLPMFSQARRNLWEAIDSLTGKTFLDFIPKNFIATIRDTDLFIRLANGSVIQPVGCDTPDKMRGIGVVGVVFSEYATATESAWHIYDPILAQSKGWAIFNSTPNGHNHFHDLVEMARRNPKEWYLSVKTIEDTQYHDGSPIISLEMIESSRRSGIPEEFIQQEYYCSFESGSMGAYFAGIIRELRETERIGSIPIDSSKRVHTAWDIGTSNRNANAIWFFQMSSNKEPIMLHYYEAHGLGLPDYINYVFDWARRNRVVLGNHYAPHDMANFDYAANATRESVARDLLGMSFKITPKLGFQDSVDAIYRVLPMCKFNESECELGIDALLSYKQDKNEKTGAWSNGPIKDWTNHAVDAFRCMAVNIASEQIEEQAAQWGRTRKNDKSRWSPYGRENMEHKVMAGRV